jgi:photosystem II stability/assembly factor-like uncharacterized protein
MEPLVGSEHLECSPDIRFVDHSVVCARQRQGGWPYECEIRGSIENSGSDYASGVAVWVEYGRELQGARSANFRAVGDLGPGEMADFEDQFVFYEPIGEYDITIKCADLIVAHPSPVPTAVNRFTRHGPAGDVFTLAIDPAVPTTLYAGTQFEGVFKSLDGGSSWVAINRGMTNRKIGALVIDPLQPATIYAGTYGTDGTNGAAYKSVDGGETWAEISRGMDGAYVLSLAIDPRTPSTIYAGTSDGLFKSTDGGGEWQSCNAGLPDDPYIISVMVDPQDPANVYAVSFGTTGEGLFSSTNGAADWSAINTGSWTPERVVMDPLPPATLYVVGWPGGLYKSTDSGSSWEALELGPDLHFEVMALVVEPERPTTLYAAIRDRDLFKSTDSGENWSVLDTNLGDVFVWTLALDPVTPSIIYAGTESGVFILGK